MLRADSRRALLSGRHNVWWPGAWRLLGASVLALVAALGVATAQAQADQYSASVMSHHPLAYLRLSESTGAQSAADSSGNGNDASISGTPTFGIPGPLPASASADTAYGLAGNANATIPNLVTPGSVTLEAWVRVTDTQGDYLQILTGDRVNGSSTRAFQFRLTPNGQVQYVPFFAGVDLTIQTTASVSDGNWHLIDATSSYDAGTDRSVASIYIDGVLRARGAAQGQMPLTGEDVCVGCASPPVGVSNFNGSIAEVAIYPSALSSSDISGQYSLGAPNVYGSAEALHYMPELLFDNTEKWRPLNVPMFLSERDPSTGTPWNQICSPSAGCTGLTGVGDLGAYPTADSYILIHNDGGDPNSYRSPTCTSTIGGTQVYDCDTGPATAIYYTVRGPHTVGGTGYDFNEYFFFYRYNQGPGVVNQGDHAGDWEGAVVGVAPGANTFEFAEFSQHGAWESYLRDNLECDGGGVASCGSESTQYVGQHLDIFPAAGSHANYPLRMTLAVEQFRTTEKTVSQLGAQTFKAPRCSLCRPPHHRELAGPAALSSGPIGPGNGARQKPGTASIHSTLIPRQARQPQFQRIMVLTSLHRGVK